ncbi:MAG: exodeoxyribonuclease V subunit alpha [Kofleriaceae bacterium]
MSTPLHPRGTLRARFEGTEQDAVFRRLGLGARACDLGDEGLYLAEEIVAADKWIGGSDPEALGILVLALMIAQRQGSSRLPLDATPRGQLAQLVKEILHIAGHDGNATQILKRIASLTSAPSFNSVIGTGEARLPLIVDDKCLYTERARYLECRVAVRLADRLAPRAPARLAVESAPEPEPPREKSNVIQFARFLAAAIGKPPEPEPEPEMIAPIAITAALEPKLTEEQRRAVELALSGKLTVVTGGPGTGKTLVAAAIVRGFQRMGITEIALAAPTGKAANRLTEVIAKELAEHAASAPGDSQSGAPVAQTLHRLLGYRGHGFVHHARSPLPAGALIVDEASMIDLALVDALLDALPASAPLVLIGDAHQLPAVDAGRILADLADPDGAANARVAVLQHSHRMDASDPRGKQVLEAAQAVHRGDAAALFTAKAPLATARTPGTLAFSGVEWVDAAKGAEIARQVTATVWHHFGGPKAQAIANDTVFRFDDGVIVAEQAQALEDLWHRIGRARILTATRGLPTGARALNAHLHELALDNMTITGKPELVPGEPVMITANDYQRGLYNGDQGIIVRADEGTGHHRYRAVFRVGTRLVPFAIEALRDRLELAWALTIHKSQGSELEAVALVLPEDDLPLITRELIYTGITRARYSVVLCGSRVAITKGASRVALRHSGLADRMRAQLATRT